MKKGALLSFIFVAAIALSTSPAWATGTSHHKSKTHVRKYAQTIQPTPKCTCYGAPCTCSTGVNGSSDSGSGSGYNTPNATGGTNYSQGSHISVPVDSSGTTRSYTALGNGDFCTQNPDSSGACPENAIVAKIPDGNGGFVMGAPGSSANKDSAGVHYDANLNPKYSVKDDGGGAKTITYADKNGSFEGGTTVSLDANGKLTDSNSESSMRANSNYENPDSIASQSSDKCQMSATIDGALSCDSTQQVITGAQVGNQVGQVVGSMATQIAGQQAQINAMSSGSVTAGYEGAAQTAKIGAEKDATLGIANLALGYWQMMKAKAHEKNADDLAHDTMGGKSALDVNDANANIKKSGDVDIQAKYDLGKKALDAFHLNTSNKVGYVHTNASMPTQDQMAREADRRSEYESKASAMGNQLRQIGSKAIGEQRKEAAAAKTGGMMSMLSGAQQTLGAAFAWETAKQAEKAAQNMAQAQALANRVVMPGIDPAATGPTTGSPIAITGNGSNPNGQAAAASDGSNTGSPGNNLPNLGSSFNPGTPPLAVNPGPSPGVFMQTPSQGPPGAAAGGGITGSASNATATPQQDQSPKLADLRGGGNYDSRGGGYMAAGMGGGGGGDKGPDIAGMLGGLLKGKQQGPAHPNGILEYNNRMPAGQMPVSLLDSSVNIFDRIHDQYQFQQKQW